MKWIPGMQIWFNIRKSNSMIYYTENPKKIKYVIFFPTDAEGCLKTCIFHSGNTVDACPPKSEKLNYFHYLRYDWAFWGEGSGDGIRQDKSIIDARFWKEEIKKYHLLWIYLTWKNIELAGYKLTYRNQQSSYT